MLKTKDIVSLLRVDFASLHSRHGRPIFRGYANH